MIGTRDRPAPCATAAFPPIPSSHVTAMTRMTRLTLPALLLLVACGGKPGVGDADPVAAAKPLLLVEEDIAVAEQRAFGQGPVISGSLQPEQRADLRAEVAGIVLEVLHDNGDAVKQGDLLVRIDPTGQRDQLLSAEAAERAASDALDQARRQLERMQTLSGKGLVTAENVEAAETRRNQAQSELASARARAVEARQQVSRTQVRAPFDGVVSARKVSAGDTAQLGKELLDVIVPGTMRLEGLIAANQVGRVEAGDAVEFRVNGYPGTTFRGQVQRVNPIANEATRQVQVMVGIDPGSTTLVAGLYAEGRIEVERRAAITAPDSALLSEGDDRFVWQVEDGALHRQAVQTGETDPRSGLVEIVSGLDAGDRLLRRPLGALREGARVELVVPVTAAVVPAAPVQSGVQSPTGL